METVFFTADRACLVSGKATAAELRAAKVISVPLEEGVLVGGGVRNPEGLQAGLRLLKEAWGEPIRSCGLVLDSSAVHNKKIEIPPVKPQEAEQIVRNEFRYMEADYDQLLVDFTPLKFVKSERGNDYMLGFAMERAFLTPYVDAFRGEGLSLKYIDVSLNALIKMVERQTSLNGRSFVFVYVLEQTLMVCLFDRGGYVYSNRVPLALNRGTTEFFNALLQEISSLLRFQKIHKDMAPVEQVCFLGLTPEERALSDSLSRLLSLPVDGELALEGWQENADITPAAVFYPLGSMLER